MFHVTFAYMFTVYYRHTKFPHGSLVIAIKPKAKYRFRAAAMLLPYIKEKHGVTKMAYFTKIF